MTSSSPDVNSIKQEEMPELAQRSEETISKGSYYDPHGMYIFTRCNSGPMPIYKERIQRRNIKEPIGHPVILTS